jgi:hypothetical protein
MSLRDEVTALIRLQLANTPLGDAAVIDTSRKSWGTTQEVTDMLIAYCSGLENAIGRLAEEIETRPGTS